MPNPTISLCMMAKNEEKLLEQCLNSVKSIADEIIIVDTGSTDKTKEIAKKFNAKIIDFKWQDDFSAARNESIKHAAKEWILVLDADETLDEDGLKAIKGLVNDKETDAFLFLQKNYTNETNIAGFVNDEHKRNGKAYSGWYGSFIARLFRNKKGYQFQGTVHELVEPSIEAKKGKIAAASVAIHHYGNADEKARKEKLRIYLELCKKKAKQNPDANPYFELGILYKENNNIEDAIKSLKKSIGLNPKHSMALYELGIVYEKQKDYDAAIKNYTESLRIKENSEAFQSLGVCYLKKGMLQEAYRNLTKAILLNPNKYTIYNNLGAVFEKMGNYDSAVQMLEIGTKINPNNTIGFYNLGIALDKKGDFGKAINAYEKAVELGHSKSEEIKKRIKQLKGIITSLPSYRYGFNVGG
ncbi:tetratricopeptide repeat protein [Candidatus Woesearchaeota archaeon]|nr:tetratricopeptide repeat protein [Candidatus Woesearchaeota archaeon]